MESGVINTQQPWGRVAGLFVACFVLFAGMLKSISPGEIVVRSFVAAVVTALSVRFFVLIVNIYQSESNGND